jgi:addiction module HigA family antidote
MSNYICARPVHPGEVLKDEIEYRGISQGKLAAQMGMSYKVLNHILNERRPLTTQTAMMFEAALGVPADSLIRLQTDYNMQVASQDRSFSDRLAQIRKMAAML